MDELQHPDIKTVLLLAELHDPLSLCVQICNSKLNNADGEHKKAVLSMLSFFNEMLLAAEESNKVKEMLQSAIEELQYAQLPSAIRMMGEKRNGR